jgi:hypothetical protein
VFAPFISTFVGQNLTTLSTLCDFLKPMMYRATHAPAGMPFETDALLRETAGDNADKKQRFYNFLGLPGSLQENYGKPFDLAFTVRDLESLAAVSACSVYAGFEINRKEKVADVFPAYIEETMKAYAQCRGFVLSWDLMDAPEENITKAAELIAHFHA